MKNQNHEDQKHYISEKGAERLLRAEGEVKYHDCPTCHNLTRFKSKAEEITEEEIVKWGNRLKPCTTCVASAKPQPLEKRMSVLPPTIFPQPSQITIWTTSDGQEFTGTRGEQEALWHELDLAKRRLNKK